LKEQYKNIKQKCFPISLFTILFTGSFSFGIPGIIPEPFQEAFAGQINAHLIVSAEDATASNTFGGPMVVEITINDPLISAINVPLGEPGVTINANKLRMAQVADGTWRGYFAALDQASGADSLGVVAGLGLDFGKFCGSTTASGVFGVDFVETDGFAIPRAGGVTGEVDGTGFSPAPFAACTGTATGGALENHVVREAPALNTDAGAAGVGQIGIDADIWPVVQLYDFIVSGSVNIVRHLE